MKRESVRKDIASSSRFPKKAMRRYVVVEGKLVYDREQKLPGRGHYLAFGSDEAEAAKRFRKILGRELSEEEKGLLHG